MRVQISQGFKPPSQDKPFLMKRSHCKNTVYDNKFTYTNVLENKVANAFVTLFFYIFAVAADSVYC